MAAINSSTLTTHASARSKIVCGVLTLVALAGLNGAFVVFFVLWSTADNAAINAMEAASGYDAAAMLPNANLMWLAAYASLALLIIVDGLVVALFLQLRK